MHSAGSFHPEWGYLAPTPSFGRTVRIAMAAAAIGTTAGLVVVVSLLRPARSHVYNTSVSAHALVSSAAIAGAAAEALAKTTTAPIGTAGPTLEPLSLDAARSIKIAPAADVSTMRPTAVADAKPDLLSARRGPVRTHRSRIVTNANRHPRHEHGFTPSFELPHNSMFAEFRQPCCAWSTQRNPPW